MDRHWYRKDEIQGRCRIQSFEHVDRADNFRHFCCMESDASTNIGNI